MRKWFVLCLLLQLASCIATTALAHSVGTSMVVTDLVDTVGVNVWPDESSTFDATSTRYLDDGYGGTDLAEILGPRWSHQAGSVRLSRRVRDMKPGPVDLVVQILSTSGVRVTATANGTQLEESEFKEGRQRFRLPSVPAAGDLLVELECEVGVWRYRIPAPHFVGFDRRARAILGSAAVLP